MRSVLSLGIARSRRRAPSKSASEGPNLPALKSSRTRSFAEGWRDENYSRDEPATVALPRTWWDCPFRAHRIEVSTGWLAHLNDVLSGISVHGQPDARFGGALTVELKK